MDPIFRLPVASPLAAAVSWNWGLIPLRVPAGWNVIHNQLWARRLPDGGVETNDSQDLYWARTAPRPWLSAEEVAERGGPQAREINIDAGWYDGVGFRVVVLDPDWDHERASHTTSDPDDFVATLEAWMWTITEEGRLPET
ncbi:hypothetical protein J4H86_25240 [Spiractinospora alimapuensis]|uniref:hypothetical protein n=1 Tax=Spiractinospora alimapuensis TaxID=2820884 RepID=UPI001F1F4DC4|nr:hypothetical protein [Spiractinospora alimapuensis]QVQ52000.1 hypothetical protein J4H86_25240 [Spiractinospora alimapuensis]